VERNKFLGYRVQICLFSSTKKTDTKLGGCDMHASRTDKLEKTNINNKLFYSERMAHTLPCSFFHHKPTFANFYQQIKSTVRKIFDYIYMKGIIHYKKLVRFQH